MKIQLLPSTFDESGRATLEQRLTCFLIDDRVAVDAGSIALALNDAQLALLYESAPHAIAMARRIRRDLAWTDEQAAVFRLGK